MELLFNELSIQPLSADKYQANDKMKLFSEAAAIARQKGFRNIRSHFAANQIGLAPDYSLYDWLNNKAGVPEIYRNYLYGMIIQPFIRDEDEEVVNDYIEANYYFEDEGSNIIKTTCIGLASAYLYETPAISLTSLPIWKQTQLQIIIEKGEATSTANVYNISLKESFDDPDIAEFIENIGEIELIETTIPHNEKSIHLRDDHGKDKLLELAKRMVRSPYVIEIPNSLPFDRYGRNFIRKVYPDGRIDITLLDEDDHYSMMIFTTGRNMRETKAIARILEDLIYFHDDI